MAWAASLSAYRRMEFRGVTLNRRTVRMLRWVEAKVGFPLQLAQGSYNGGARAVAASGGTHDGGGAVDIRTSPLSDRDRVRVVLALKRAGFAAWYREAIPGLWGPHIHAIARGDRDLSSGAASQVVSFDAHRDGLRANAWDATYRPSPRRRWSYLLDRPRDMKS